MSNLSNANIPSMIYYKRLSFTSCFEKLGYKKVIFQYLKDVSKQIFSIPMHPYLDKEKQNKIIEVLNKN